MRTQLLLLPALVIGCGQAPPDAEERTFEGNPGTNEFSLGWSYALSTSGTSSQDLGPAAGRTCFLSGVAGHIDSPDHESIAVTNQSGEYTLFVDTEKPVKVWTRCVNGAGTAEVARGTTQGDVVIAPVATGRRCFFTQLGFSRHNKAPPEPSGMLTASSEVQIVNDGVNWKFPALVNGQVPPLDMVARCVDGSVDEGAVGVQAATHGTYVATLPSESGTTCGLQELKGAYTVDDTTDGAYVTRDDASGNLTLTVTNGKHAIVGCLK